MTQGALTTQTASYAPPTGAGPAEIDTPALLIDYETLTRNISRMAEFAAGGPAKLRPHSKTHKCVEIAELQLDAGAVGITCAKVGEAEALADGGIPDILIANEIVGSIKIARLVALAQRCHVTVAVDDPVNVRELSAAAAAAGVTIGCYVEVDVGMRRCGVPERRRGACASARHRREPRPCLLWTSNVRGTPAEPRAAGRAARAHRPRSARHSKPRRR